MEPLSRGIFGGERNMGFFWGRDVWRGGGKEEEKEEEGKGGYNDDRNSPIPLESPPIVGYSLSVSLGNRVWALPYSWREGQDRRLTKTFQGREKFLSVTGWVKKNMGHCNFKRKCEIWRAQHNPPNACLKWSVFFFFSPCRLSQRWPPKTKQSDISAGRTNCKHSTLRKQDFDWVCVCVWLYSMYKCLRGWACALASRGRVYVCKQEWFKERSDGNLLNDMRL